METLRKHLATVLFVPLIFVVNFSALTNLYAETSAMNVVSVTLYSHDEETVPGGQTTEVGRPVPVNGLVKNLSHTGEHFDYITEYLDSSGVVIHIHVKSSVAVPLGHELWIDSEAPITFNNTGNYYVRIFTWVNTHSLPEPLSSGSEIEVKVTLAACEGKADCITGIVTKVVDGDTLDINGTRIRLAIVNTPEVGQPGYKEAKQFTSNLCPVGSKAVADEDDGQPEGSYNRVIAKVTCGDKVLNEELLKADLAEVLTKFCGVSEFRNENWAKSNGC